LQEVATSLTASSSSSSFRSQGTLGDPVRFSKQDVLGIAIPYFI